MNFDKEYKIDFWDTFSSLTLNDKFPNTNIFIFSDTNEQILKMVEQEILNYNDFNYFLVKYESKFSK